VWKGAVTSCYEHEFVTSGPLTRAFLVQLNQYSFEERPSFMCWVTGKRLMLSAALHGPPVVGYIGKVIVSKTTVVSTYMVETIVVFNK
jgi:hypothetical protein